MDKQTIRDMILARNDLKGQESLDALTEIEDAIDELLEEHAKAFLDYYQSHYFTEEWNYYKDFLQSIENEK